MADLQKVENFPLFSQHNQKKFGLDAHFLADGLPKPVVLFIHGFNGFKDWGHFNLIGEYFARQGFVWVKFNLSHNGTSYEQPTSFVDEEAYAHDYFSRDLDDIGTVLDFLWSADCPFASQMDLNRAAIIGHSRGGALALLKAGEEARIRAVATWASITSTLHFWNPQNIETVRRDGKIGVYNGRTKQQMYLNYEYYEDVLQNSERLDVERAVRSLTIPTLIAHGTADESISPQSAETLLQWKPNAQLHWVEDANHTFGGKEPWETDTLPAFTLALAENTLAFLKQHLS